MTSTVPQIVPEELTGEAAEIYAEKMAKTGLVTNMVRTLLHSMPSYRAMEFYPVRDQLTKIVGSRAVYFYCYAISVEDECTICSLYHARLLNQLGLEFKDFEFTEVEDLLIAYGRALVNSPAEISETILEGLRARFSAEEIVLITTVGIKMIASNLFNIAMKVDLDDYLFDVKFDDSLMAKAGS